MEKLNELIEKIGDFSFVEYLDETFQGILIKENKDFIIKGRISLDLYKKLSNSYENDIIGIIYGYKLTFINSCIQNRSFNYTESSMSDWYAEIKPEKIILGEYFLNGIMIKGSSPIYGNIHNWLLDSPIKTDHGNLKDGSNLLIFKDTEEHNVKHNNINLTFYKTFDILPQVDKTEVSTSTIISFEFDDPVNINECVKYMADFRNFLAFFANYYIEFNSFEFITYNNNTIFNCYMNYCEDMDFSNKPFVINFSNIQNEFNILWSNWIEFSNKSNNIVSLFYEILCGRATRINKFLNLCQALESYSYIYRTNKADQVRIAYNMQKCTKIKKLLLLID